LIHFYKRDKRVTSEQEKTVGEYVESWSESSPSSMPS